MPASLPDDWLPDPFTAVYRKLRTGLLAYSGFIAALNGNANNFIDMSDDKFRKFDEQLKDTDLPEVVMVQTGRKIKPFGTNSMVASGVQSYDIMATVRRLNVLDVNAINWNAFVALYGLGTNLGLSGGLVTDWIVSDAADSAFGQQEWKRGTIRYVALTRIDVTLAIPRQLLRNLLTP